MAKEAYYFSHDSNARHDEKILAMRSVYKGEGYGWYWMLVEMMRDANAYRLQCDGMYWSHAIADELRCDVDVCRKFITDCIKEFRLFESDGAFFWSESLKRRMVEKDAKSLKAKESANARWNKDANALRTHKTNHANASKTDAIKERKGKERNIRIFVPPAVEDVVNYFKLHGYSEEIAVRAHRGYQEADWHDSTGKPVKNWKQKMNNVWFKEEHKTVMAQKSEQNKLIQHPIGFRDSLYGGGQP